MILRSLFGLLPGLLLLTPWAVLTLLGAREDVLVITGMLPPDRPVEALLFGAAYVVAWLVAWVFAPPVLFTGMCIATFGRQRHR